MMEQSMDWALGSRFLIKDDPLPKVDVGQGECEGVYSHTLYLLHSL